MWFHIRFLTNGGSAWLLVPSFNFEHMPLQTSLHDPAQSLSISAQRMSCFTLVFYCHIFISQQFNLMSLLKRIWTHNWRIKESQLFNLLRSAVNYFHSNSRGLTIFEVLTQEKQKTLKIYSVNICYAEMLVCWHNNSLKTRLSPRNGVRCYVATGHRGAESAACRLLRTSASGYQRRKEGRQRSFF